MSKLFLLSNKDIKDIAYLPKSVIVVYLRMSQLIGSIETYGYELVPELKVIKFTWKDHWDYAVKHEGSFFTAINILRKEGFITRTTKESFSKHPLGKKVRIPARYKVKLSGDRFPVSDTSFKLITTLPRFTILTYLKMCHIRYNQKESENYDMITVREENIEYGGIDHSSYCKAIKDLETIGLLKRYKKTQPFYRMI